MEVAFIKSIKYENESHTFFSLLFWIKLWKCINAWGYEDALTLFEFFFIMYVCYLHGSTWIVYETLDENGCMMHEKVFFLFISWECMNEW